jgi:hypothetical protein
MNGPSSRWRGWLVAGAIFLLGVAAGGAGMTWAGIQVFRQRMQNPASTRGMADRAAERIGADLKKSLQLSAEESAQVQAILNQSAVNLKAIRVQAATQAAAELRASTVQIARTLPVEKRREFYRLIAKRFGRLGLSAPQPEQEP